MSSKEVEEFIKLRGITKLPPDPALSKRNGYELAMKYGASGIARAAKDHEDNKEFLRQKNAKNANILNPTSATRGFEGDKAALKGKFKKDRRKARRKGKLPITPRQIRFLHAIGMKDPEKLSKAQAHHLISQHVRLERENDILMAEAMDRDG